MAVNLLNAEVRLINDSIKFSCTSGDNPPIVTDYYPPLGNNEGYTALEVFLVSLGSCTSGTVIPLLRKMRKTIKDYKMSLEGTRRSEHPTSLSKIVMKIFLKSNDITEADLDKAVSMAEEKYCPVWAMIKGNVAIERQYTIEKEE
jgi:putative redox protein